MNEFIEEYRTFSDSEKIKFSKSINKLINEKYLTSECNEDKDHYYFIADNINIINKYLTPLDMNVCLNKNLKVISLQEENSTKLQLSKLNSIILLIIRLIYNEGLKEVSLSNQVITTTKRIRDYYDNLGFSNDKRLDNSKICECLKLLKKYNIVTFRGNDFSSDDFLITIYPTILVVLEAMKIEEIYEKINSYKEDKNEEVIED